MREVLKNAWLKLHRDLERDESVTHVISKSARYAWELASAQLWLVNVDVVGRGVRTYGRPLIDNHGAMKIGAHTVLRSAPVRVELATMANGELEIGDDCSINYGVSIGCLKSVRLGNRVRLGPYVMIVDNGFHELYDRAQRPESRPVVIEDDVWIGAKASVMPGVTIGRGSVVGTSAVVTRDVAPFTVVAGVPAQVVKTLDPAKFITPVRAVAD